MTDELYTKEQVEETIKKIKDEIYHLAFRVYEGREMLDRKEILVNIDNYITKNLSLRGFEKVTKKVNDEEAILPKENSDGSYFLYSPKDYICEPGTITHIYFDLKVRMPSDELFAFNIVHTLTNRSKTGYINSSYYYHERLEGNIHIVLTNDTDHVFTIKKGDLLARGKFIKDFTCGYCTSAMGEMF